MAGLGALAVLLLGVPAHALRERGGEAGGEVGLAGSTAAGVGAQGLLHPGGAALGWPDDEEELEAVEKA